MLVAAGACHTQREYFKEVFGYKCAISKKNLIKARKAGLWIFWFMDTFVGDENRNEFKEIVNREYHDHTDNIKYDFDAAIERIIDRFLFLFENNNNEYYWSENPF
jgi:hypothetical protein